jgi:hypothetical protein
MGNGGPIRLESLCLAVSKNNILGKMDGINLPLSMANKSWEEKFDYQIYVCRSVYMCLFV